MKSKLNFDHVLSSKTRSQDELFTVFYVKNKLNHCRLGVSLPKKIIARATARSKTKRTIKNSFSAFFQATKGIDVVVRARRGSQTNTSEKTLQSLEQHWITIMRHNNKMNKANGKP